jgi:hypothetical protein
MRSPHRPASAMIADWDFSMQGWMSQTGCGKTENMPWVIPWKSGPSRAAYRTRNQNRPLGPAYRFGNRLRHHDRGRPIRRGFRRMDIPADGMKDSPMIPLQQKNFGVDVRGAHASKTVKRGASVLVVAHARLSPPPDLALLVCKNQSDPVEAPGTMALVGGDLTHTCTRQRRTPEKGRSARKGRSQSPP